MTTPVPTLAAAIDQLVAYLDGKVPFPAVRYDTRSLPMPYVAVSAVGSRSGDTEHEVRVTVYVSHTEMQSAQAEIVEYADLIEDLLRDGGYGPPGFDPIDYNETLDCLLTSWTVNVPKSVW